MLTVTMRRLVAIAVYVVGRQSPALGSDDLDHNMHIEVLDVTP